MAKRPSSARTGALAPASAKPIVAAATVEPSPVIPEVPIVPVKPVDAPALLTAWLLMKTGLSGPDFCLSSGDKHPFDHTPGPVGEPSEAQRLVDAGFADFCDAPED